MKKIQLPKFDKFFWQIFLKKLIFFSACSPPSVDQKQFCALALRRMYTYLSYCSLIFNFLINHHWHYNASRCEKNCFIFDKLPHGDNAFLSFLIKFDKLTNISWHIMFMEDANLTKDKSRKIKTMSCIVESF